MLLGELGEQAPELLEGCGPPRAAVGVDAEIDPGGGHRRVGDPVGDRRLDGDILEVGGPAVEHEGLLAVVDRDLAQGGGEGPEPERLAGPVVHQLAVVEMAHVRGGVGPEVSQEEVAGDVGHRRLLVLVISTISPVHPCRQDDDYTFAP